MTNRKLYVTSLLVAVLLVFAVHFLDFPGSVPDLRRASGGGVLLDVRPSLLRGRNVPPPRGLRGRGAGQR